MTINRRYAAQMQMVTFFLSLLSTIILLPAYVTANSYVPDDVTAIAIAKAVLRQLIDRSLIDGPKALPFYASLEAPPYSNIWYVENAPPARLKWVTPIIRVEMEKDSGRILKVVEPIDVYDPPPFHERENIWVIMGT